MHPVPDLSDIDVAFGAATRIFDTLPTWDSIPAEFKQRGTHNRWVRVFSGIFYGSKDKCLLLCPREGVDHEKAWRAVSACSSSFAPKHEHKEAGVAYLLSQWFLEGAWVRPRGKQLAGHVHFADPSSGVSLQEAARLIVETEEEDRRAREGESHA